MSCKYLHVYIHVHVHVDPCPSTCTCIYMYRYMNVHTVLDSMVVNGAVTVYVHVQTHTFTIATAAIHKDGTICYSTRHSIYNTTSNYIGVRFI